MANQSNVYVFRGYCFPTPRELFVTDSTRLGVDGARKIKTENFTIQNLDPSNAMYVSFDATSYFKVDVGAAFADKLMTDRYYVKSDNSSEFQAAAALKSGW